MSEIVMLDDELASVAPASAMESSSPEELHLQIKRLGDALLDVRCALDHRAQVGPDPDPGCHILRIVGKEAVVVQFGQARSHLGRYGPAASGGGLVDGYVETCPGERDRPPDPDLTTAHDGDPAGRRAPPTDRRDSRR